MYRGHGDRSSYDRRLRFSLLFFHPRNIQEDLKITISHHHFRSAFSLRCRIACASFIYEYIHLHIRVSAQVAERYKTGKKFVISKGFCAVQFTEYSAKEMLPLVTNSLWKYFRKFKISRKKSSQFVIFFSYNEQICMVESFEISVSFWLNAAAQIRQLFSRRLHFCWDHVNDPNGQLEIMGLRPRLSSI